MKHMWRYCCVLVGRFFRIQLPRPTLAQVLKFLFFLGTACMIFVLGAAAMHFRIPPADFLRKAFWEAAHAANEKKKEADEEGSDDVPEAGIGILADNPAQTFDGFTLITTTDGPWAALIDMKGQLVHRWELPFSKAWSKLDSIQYPVEDSKIHWFGCHLFPNGDLLAVYHATDVTPYGYGLIKLTRDSKPLWGYSAQHIHHEIDVDENDGTIYAISQSVIDEVPRGLNLPKKPYIADALVVLSPEGKEIIKPLPVLEAIGNSKYSLLSTLIDQGYKIDVPGVTGPGTLLPGAPQIKFPARAPARKIPGVPSRPDPLRAASDQDLVLRPRGLDPRGDYTHANSVQVVTRRLAPRFPFLKEGQVLMSLRNLDALIAVDIPTRSVVWAARGLWKHQHSPQLLDNGNILLYDNLGSSKQTRLLEFDPLTGAFPWSYASENSRPFKAPVRGMVQRLPNGNTLFDNPDRCRLLEVNRDKEIVWDIVCREAISKPKNNVPTNQITYARRFPEEQLKFLKAGTHARP